MMVTDRGLALMRMVGMSFALLVGLLSMATPARADGDGLPMIIFAAASTKTVIDAGIQAFSAQSANRVVASYAATSVLARQVERAAPADIIVTANRQWMTYLQARGLIDADSVLVIAGNRLALVAGAQASLPPALLPVRPDMPLAAALGRNGRLAIADPRHVPAGQYAQAALENLGVWGSVRGRLAPAGNVRLALAQVERGNSPLGIVYHSDAVASRLAGQRNVRLLGHFPADSHPPIQYLAARVSQSTHAGAAAMLRFLVSANAQALFNKAGFSQAVR